MVGYTEAITDPSYHGQILVQTYPLIGNYGVSPTHYESDGPKIEGYVVRELCREPSHWTSETTLDEWLTETGVPGIEHVDTRMLTKCIRNKGTMKGLLQVYEDGKLPNLNELRKEVRRIQDPNERELAYDVATDRIRKHNAGGDFEVALIDCGVKSSMIRNIVRRGVNVVQFPPKSRAEEIIDTNPLGVIISNGPGNPKMYAEVIETTRRIIAANIPVFGICLGCQILALSLGGDTYKLKFGHRGQNHPCIDLESGRCFITSQNHGFAIDAKSLERNGLEVTLINANDRTVEGFKHRNLPLMAVQFHPEASPGPNDTNDLFDRFVKSFCTQRRENVA
jgi:carbamoyl-phosphate synthase small subunit